jgi:hypothetical protein
LGHLICDAFETAHGVGKDSFICAIEFNSSPCWRALFHMRPRDKMLLNPFDLAVPHAYFEVGDGGGLSAVGGHDDGCAELVRGAADEP